VVAVVERPGAVLGALLRTRWSLLSSGEDLCLGFPRQCKDTVAVRDGTGYATTLFSRTVAYVEFWSG